MKKLMDKNVNTKEFWDTQYAPQRQEHYRNGNLAYPKYKNSLDYVSDGDKVCDMACGFGIFAIYAKDAYPNCEVHGFDMVDMIDQHREDYPDIDWTKAKIGEEDIGGDYDVVFAGDVVEHLDDPLVVFTDAHRLLKKGGILIVTTPDGDIEKYAESPDHVWIMGHDDIEKMYREAKFGEVEFPYIQGPYGVLFITALARKL